MAAVTASSLDVLDIVSAQGTQSLKSFGSQAKLLGKGGAGTVYAHPGIPKHALKIYSTTERAETHAAKVRAMLKAPPRDVRTRMGAVQIAWPTATVMSHGRFVGFAMPQIDFAHAWTLQQITQPTQRKRRGVPERMELRLYAGRNLASVLHSLHAVGHYVVDLKPQNVLVYRDDAGRNAAHIVLIDCDGFQIREPGGQRFDAELATPQFLHPDLAVQVDDEASFDAKRLNDKAELQDDFALAVILFQLLNDGLHPMSGVETGASNVPSDLAARLQSGGTYYPYAVGRANPNIRPDADSLHEWFSAELRTLFDAAFSRGSQPPKPQAWINVLSQLADPNHRCPKNADHWMLGSQCGLCARENKLSVPQPISQMTLPPPIPSALVLANPVPNFIAGTKLSASSRSDNRSGWRAFLITIALALGTIWFISAKQPYLRDLVQSFELSSIISRVRTSLGEKTNALPILSDQQHLRATPLSKPTPQSGISAGSPTAPTEIGPAVAHHPPIGPGRSCDSVSMRDSYVALVCSDDRLARAWLELNQAGYALRYQMGDDNYRRTMGSENATAWKRLTLSCPITPDMATSSLLRFNAVSCMMQQIYDYREKLLGLTSGEAGEEARRDINDHVALQKKLIDLGYLTGPSDGNYGPATRAAIVRYRSDNAMGARGFLSDEVANRLARSNVPDDPDLLTERQRKEQERRDTPPDDN